MRGRGSNIHPSVQFFDWWKVFQHELVSGRRLQVVLDNVVAPSIKNQTIWTSIESIESDMEFLQKMLSYEPELN